jgi:hypothetical protein
MGGFAPSLPVGTLNVALSNYAKEFRNNMLVGDMLAPRVPVARQSFQYLVFDRSNQRLDRQTLRAPGAIPQSDRMSYSALPYFCQSHALRAKIPYEQEQYALGLGFSEKQAATRRLMDKLALDRENYIAQLLFTAGNVTNTMALAGNAMFDSYLGGNTSQPTQVIEYGKSVVRQSGVEANALILSDPVITALVNNPIIVQRFQYTKGGAIGLDELSTVFGIKCYRAAAVALNDVNAASYIWGTNAVLAYVQDATSQQDLSGLKTFDWTAAPETVGGYGVLEFPEPNLDAKADIISVDWYWDTRITAQETLFTFTNCVAAPTMAAIAAPGVGY